MRSLVRALEDALEREGCGGKLSKYEMTNVLAALNLMWDGRARFLTEGLERNAYLESASLLAGAVSNVTREYLGEPDPGVVPELELPMPPGVVRL